MKRTKATAIASNVLGASARNSLVKILRRFKFSILIDESTDISSKKSSCVLARYFNPDVQRVTSSFLALVNLFEDNEDSIASAEVIFGRVTSVLEANDVPLDNCIGFASDGCNTMMGSNNSVMTRFQAACPGIYISKCICHSLHICASNAAAQLPRRCEDLVKDVYNFFKQSAKRKSIFSAFQEMADVAVLQILHPAQTRWLSFHPAVSRMLQQWNALLPFFEAFNLKEKLESADRILENLKDTQMKLYYVFLDWVLPKFNLLNAFFQSSKVVIITAHDKICRLFKEFLACFLETKYIDTTSLAEIDPMSSNQLNNNEMYLGSILMMNEQELARIAHATDFTSRQKLPANRFQSTAVKKHNAMMNDLKTRCRNFLQTACIEIKKRYNFSDNVLSKLYIFSPKYAIDSSIRQRFPTLTVLSTLLPRCIPNKVTEQQIDDEWRYLPYTELPEEILSEEEVDVFWGKLMQFKSENEVRIFKNISLFVLNILSLPHSNADSERIFSQVNNIKTKLRNRLINNTINGVILAKELIKLQGNCIAFEPTNDMYGRFNATMYDDVDSENDIKL